MISTRSTPPIVSPGRPRRVEMCFSHEKPIVETWLRLGVELKASGAMNLEEVEPRI